MTHLYSNSENFRPNSVGTVRNSNMQIFRWGNRGEISSTRQCLFFVHDSHLKYTPKAFHMSTTKQQITYKQVNLSNAHSRMVRSNKFLFGWTSEMFKIKPISANVDKASLSWGWYFTFSFQLKANFYSLKNGTMIKCWQALTIQNSFG